MKTGVLDSWPIIEWINERQPVTDAMDHLLAGAESGALRLFMSAINVGEIYYFLRKRHSEDLAEFWRSSSESLPVTIEVPTANEIWDAAILKSLYPISFADAFAAALAQKHSCSLVTGDPELRSVSGLELDWLGPV
ncbi:MAG TPA: PIN domain-containing protein [Silvibacterium sp.]|nr:PIN domain-containing protein [Silvibacterium sp.]